MRQSFTDLAQHRALNLWATRGWDTQNGGSFEAMAPSGMPLSDLPKRTRVQLRQIYVYAHAHVLGLRDSTAIIGELFDFLEAGALANPEAGCAHLLSPTGAVVDTTRDLYDHAFLLLAVAWAYRALKDTRYLTLAHQTMHYLDDALKAPNGGWFESDTETDTNARRRRQNPHMHLFEAFLALHAATQEAEWLNRATDILDLFQARFYDPERECLLEYFTPDWTPLSTGEQAIEPGHMLEWSWLLDQYGQAANEDMSGISAHLLDKALTRGVNEHTGLVFNRLSPCGAVADTSHRLWPQTELIKALIVAAERGDPMATQQLDEAVCALMAKFVSPEDKALWIDCVDAFGTPVNRRAPASTFYHVFCAAAEYSRFMLAATPTDMPASVTGQRALNAGR